MQAPIAGEVSETNTSSASDETTVVLLTAGGNDGGQRATLAFAAATCAAAMNKKAIMFLVGDGTHWAYETHTKDVKSTGFPALAELMESLLEMGGSIFVCTAQDQGCADPAVSDQHTLRRHPAVEPRRMSAMLSAINSSRCVTF